jgi:hypothetical protein
MVKIGDRIRVVSNEIRFAPFKDKMLEVNDISIDGRYISCKGMPYSLCEKDYRIEPNKNKT